ncbi:MAG: hypothetical protein ABSG32_01730 [Terriglobia bacterium]|jgi:hypothetical protein
MSLLKKPTMTEKKVAANRRNQSLSHGPVTAEGKARIGAAQLRRGYYAKAQEVALRSLGEDPAHFEELRQGLYEEFTPVGTLQEELVGRLARVLWLVERADRSLEGDALRRARSADHGRDNRLHARMMRLKMTAETLRSLARAAAVRHYVTTPEDLEVMKKLHQQGVAAEMGEIALDLFYQLQVPGTDQSGVSAEEKARRVVNSIRSIFGIGQMESDVEMLTPSGERMIVRAHASQEARSPDDEESEESDLDDRYPTITEEDWIPREQARKLLRNILSRQAEACEAQREALLKESLEGPSPYELAVEIAPSPADALLMRRIQDANMREVRRLTNLLLKMKRRKRKMEPLEAAGEAPQGTVKVLPG